MRLTRVPATLRNLLRGGAGALAVRGGRRVPLGVYLVLTTRCTACCTYCGYESLRAAGEQELGTAEACGWLREMARCGTVKVNLTGGEPLAHPGIAEILETARAAGFYTVVSTNGHLVPRHADALTAAADMVQLSYDGGRAVHDRLRGDGSHDRAVEAMDILRARGIRFMTTTVLTAANLGEIDHIVAVARAHGTAANFTLLHQWADDGRGPHHIPPLVQVENLLPSAAAVRDACDRLMALKRAGHPVGSTLPFLRLLRGWPDYRLLLADCPPEVPCLAGRAYCHVYFDGRLYPCGHAFGTGYSSDLRRIGFREAFRTLPRLPGCTTCRAACDVENSLVYNLHPGALGNWLGRVLR